MKQGDKVNFFNTSRHLWSGWSFPIGATVMSVNNDGSLNIDVEQNGKIRHVQNVLPRDQGEDHFWYEAPAPSLENREMLKA